MQTIQKHRLILSLIKDDLINLRLIYGLEQMGIHASDYMLHLSNCVFELMDFRADDKYTDHIHSRYMALSSRVTDINIIESPELLDALAQDIYGYLCNCTGTDVAVVS